MFSIKISSDKLKDIPYINKLSSNSDISNKICFDFDNISTNTKLLILSYLETSEIIKTFLNDKTIDELKFLGYDELINKINKTKDTKDTFISKKDKILGFYEKYKNKLVFTETENYQKFIETFDESLINESNGSFGFIHCFAYYAKDPLNYELLKTVIQDDTIDVNFPSTGNCTAIIYASYLSNSDSSEEAVKLLLEHPKININLQNKMGMTALMCACMYSNTTSTEGTVKMLLEHPDIDVNLQDYVGDTAAMIALRQHSINSTKNTFEMLLEHPNIDINLETNNGWTLLKYLRYMYINDKNSEWKNKMIDMVLKHPDIIKSVYKMLFEK